MPTHINLGLIGLGRLGLSYAQLLASRVNGARLIAVADPVPQAVEAASSLTSAKAYSDYRELLANPAIDAVVVVTPTRFHCEVVTAAAQAGKAIFCEKPLSLSLTEGALMNEAVRQAGVFFQLGFMRRFDAGYASARKQVVEGAIGRPCVFKSTSRDRERPSLEYLSIAASGGLFLDMGIHDFDLARWFMGEVKNVYATAGVLAYPEMSDTGDWDNSLTNLTFANGALGMVCLSRNGVYGYGIHTEIVGTEGTIQIGYDRQTPVRLLKPNSISHDTVPGFNERFESAYLAQLQNFVDNLSEGRPPAITCDDGIAAQKIAAAATLSARENRPVSL